LVWVVRIAKLLGFILVMAVLALSLTTAWVVWRFRASVPEIEGAREVAGRDGPIVIARDEHGVPHIFGTTDADVYFGLGYAHAQDRLFQMDLIRRSIEGRLAELIPSVIGGSAVVRADARARIQGYPRAAQAIADNFDGPLKKAVDAYVAGVNAVMEAPGFTPPPEYTLLMAKPEPWDAADTAAVWVYITDDLVSGATQEYERRELAGQLSPQQIEEFVAGYPDFGQRSLALPDLLAENPSLARPGPEAHDDAAPQSGVETGPTPGSNNWVIDGRHSRSGKPLLANDPHLALRSPNVWYLARLALPEGNVVGGTIPGGPIVVLGRNERIAWGFTNTGYDVIDYLVRPEGAAVASERQEIIKVRGGSDVTITVREAAEGPILDPAYFNLGPFGTADVVLATTADDLDNASPNFSFALMAAGSWDEVVEAGPSFTAPMQNIVYADVDGNIGYLSPGRLPLRGPDGSWTGVVPYEDLPRVLNPASGMIATANNKVTPDSYPYPMPGEFSVYRISRIHERLAETALHDLESFRAIQLDVRSDFARRLLPSVERARPATDAGRALQGALLNWNGTMNEGAAEPLIFSAWLEALHAALYADELGDLFPRFDALRATFVDRVLSGELSQWCDDVATPADETCAETMGKAFDAAASRLTESYGEDPSLWTWGAAHQAVFPHPLMSSVPLLKDLYTVRVDHGGDASTVNVGHFRFGGDFSTFHAGSLRAIYDLSDLDASLFSQAPGQSGHPLSPHYSDLAGPWAAGVYLTIDTSWELRRPPPGMSILELVPAD
jgi:penicillin amidase